MPIARAEDQPEEEFARQYFDNLLDRVKKEKKVAAPSHARSIFFWENPDTAESVRQRITESNFPEQYTTLEVDAQKNPCLVKCVSANNKLAEETFFKVTDLYPPDEGDTPTGTDALRYEKQAKKLAERYVKTIEPYKCRNRADFEVLCPCDIPPEVIVE